MEFPAGGSNEQWSCRFLNNLSGLFHRLETHLSFNVLNSLLGYRAVVQELRLGNWLPHSSSWQSLSSCCWEAEKGKALGTSGVCWTIHDFYKEMNELSGTLYWSSVCCSLLSLFLWRWYWILVGPSVACLKWSASRSLFIWIPGLSIPLILSEPLWCDTEDLDNSGSSICFLALGCHGHQSPLLMVCGRC